MNDLIVQLKHHCLCLGKKDDELERALERALALFSTFTCGNSILKKRKTERRRLDRECDCSCEDDYLRFYPFWPNAHNYEVSIETITGLKVTPQSALFAELSEGEIKVDISDAPCRSCTCDESFLVVQYDAFWDIIPDDLIPFFCDLMNAILIIQKNACGTCTNCKNFKGSDMQQWIADNGGDEMSFYSLEKYIYGYYDRILRKYSLCRKAKVFGVKAGK